MNKRTREYIKRKKAFQEVLHPTSLRQLLKAEFNSTNNLMVKRHILQTFHNLFGNDR